MRTVKAPSGNDVIWVIMDQLMKSAYFLLIRVGFSLKRLVKLYINVIMRLHDAPIFIVSD